MINPVKSTEVFYKPVGNDNDVNVKDDNVPFLTQSSWLSVARAMIVQKWQMGRQAYQFKEVIGKETIGEDSVTYKKIKTPDDQGKNI